MKIKPANITHYKNAIIKYFEEYTLTEMKFDKDIIKFITINSTNEVYVVMNQLVKNIGLIWSRQLQKLKNKEELLKIRHYKVASNNGTHRDTICIPLKCLPKWFECTNSTKLQKNKKKFLRYKKKIYTLITEFLGNNNSYSTFYNNESNEILQYDKTMHTNLNYVLNQFEKYAKEQGSKEANYYTGQIINYIHGQMFGVSSLQVIGKKLYDWISDTQRCILGTIKSGIIKYINELMSKGEHFKKILKTITIAIETVINNLRAYSPPELLTNKELMALGYKI